jgi:hypothetical protein
MLFFPDTLSLEERATRPLQADVKNAPAKTDSLLDPSFDIVVCPMGAEHDAAIWNSLGLTPNESFASGKSLRRL